MRRAPTGGRCVTSRVRQSPPLSSECCLVKFLRFFQAMARDDAGADVPAEFLAFRNRGALQHVEHGALHAESDPLVFRFELSEGLA